MKKASLKHHNWNDLSVYIYGNPATKSSRCLQRFTGFGRCVDKDGELHTIFLCRANTWNGPRESDEHAVEGWRDAHRQSVVDHFEPGNQLVRLVVTTVIDLQRAVSRWLNIHLKDVQCQPVSNDSPEQLQPRFSMQRLVNQSQVRPSSGMAVYPHIQIPHPHAAQYWYARNYDSSSPWTLLLGQWPIRLIVVFCGRKVPQKGRFPAQNAHKPLCKILCRWLYPHRRNP